MKNLFIMLLFSLVIIGALILGCIPTPTPVPIPPGFNPPITSAASPLSVTGGRVSIPAASATQNGYQPSSAVLPTGATNGWVLTANGTTQAWNNTIPSLIINNTNSPATGGLLIYGLGSTHESDGTLNTDGFTGYSGYSSTTNPSRAIFGLYAGAFVNRTDADTDSYVNGAEFGGVIGPNNTKNWTRADAIVGIRPETDIKAGATGTFTGAMAIEATGYVAGGTLTNRYGLHVNDAIVTAPGILTNQYGVYIPALTSGTNNYSIYNAGTATAYFGGNLGIGTNAPIRQLEISGVPIQDGAVWSQFNVDSTTPFGSNPTAGITFSTIYDNGLVKARLAGIAAGKDNSIAGDYGGWLAFYTRETGSNIVEAMRIATTGYIGMGTSDFPLERLVLSGLSSGDSALRLQNTTPGTGQSYSVMSDTAGAFAVYDRYSPGYLFYATAGYWAFNGVSSRIKIGNTTERSTKGTNSLDFFNGSAPAGTLANGASIYATGGKLYAIDSSGAVTQITP